MSVDGDEFSFAYSEESGSRPDQVGCNLFVQSLVWHMSHTEQQIVTCRRSMQLGACFFLWAEVEEGIGGTGPRSRANDRGGMR